MAAFRQWRKPPGGGKSGLHGRTVPGNARRGRPQGQCHRKQTAGGLTPVRVKGCGKSAPRSRRRERHGKPHREQDRIGAARAEISAQASSAPSPGLVARGVRQRASQMNGHPPAAAPQGERAGGQNPAYRPSGIYPFIADDSGLLAVPKTLLAAGTPAMGWHGPAAPLPTGSWDGMGNRRPILLPRRRPLRIHLPGRFSHNILWVQAPPPWGAESPPGRRIRPP